LDGSEHRRFATYVEVRLLLTGKGHLRQVFSIKRAFRDRSKPQRYYGYSLTARSSVQARIAVQSRTSLAGICLRAGIKL
jgi:hypothetical protein